MANLTMKMLQKQINELKDEISILKSNTKHKKIPCGLKIGDTFNLAGINWKILDINDKGYMCLADKLKDSMVFDGESNNWRESSLREYLNNDFYNRISDAIGEDDIILFKRDLLSLDGQTECGECEDYVSLLTLDEYRRYRNLIPNTDEYWWWLISPWSTPCNGYKQWEAVVSSSGFISNYCCFNNCGVRPVCIFSYAIFESEE